MNNIVIDCEKMRYPNTGFYFFCKNLATHIIAQANGINGKVSLYLPQKELSSFNKNCHSILFNPLHKFYMPSTNINVWHSTTQMSNYLPSSKKISVVLTIHDLNIIYEQANNVSLIRHKLKKIQDKIDRAEKIVTISYFVKDDILNNLKVGNKDISVIYNGCNMPLNDSFTIPVIKPNQPFLFAIGAINAKKNFHVLPRLLPFNNYHLVISGITDDPNYKQKIIEEALKYNVLERIIFTGAISDNDKYWYFNNCLAFVFPSLAEGFGLPVVEAMYFGKPVFLSNKTSLPEIGGDLAFYFENFDVEHMQQVFSEGMQQNGNSNTLATNLKKQAAVFNWKTAAQQYLQLYRSL